MSAENVSGALGRGQKFMEEVARGEAAAGEADERDASTSRSGHAHAGVATQSCTTDVRYMRHTHMSHLMGLLYT